MNSQTKKKMNLIPLGNQIPPKPALIYPSYLFFPYSSPPLPPSFPFLPSSLFPLPFKPPPRGFPKNAVIIERKGGAEQIHIPPSHRKSHFLGPKIPSSSLTIGSPTKRRVLSFGVLSCEKKHRSEPASRSGHPGVDLSFTPNLREIFDGIGAQWISL